MFSENLKKYRLNKNFSQKAIADMVGKKQATYSRWEAGLVEPSLDQIKKLSTILDTTPNDLLGWNSDNQAPAA